MRKAFTQANYIAWAILFACIVYAAIAWIPLVGFIDALAVQTPSLPSIIPVIASLLISGLFNLSAADTRYALLLAPITGVNLSMLLYYLRKARVRSSTPAGAGIVGFFVGILGFGCAACGALFARTVLATIAGAGLADRLPQSGLLFQAIGVALILYSIWQLNRAINDPLTCEQ